MTDTHESDSEMIEQIEALYKASSVDDVPYELWDALPRLLALARDGIKSRRKRTEPERLVVINDEGELVFADGEAHGTTTPPLLCPNGHSDLWTANPPDTTTNYCKCNVCGKRFWAVLHDWGWQLKDVNKEDNGTNS